MKIVLLDSPSWRLFAPTMHVHLGILYLAGSLRGAGFDVTIADPHYVTSWDKANERLTIHPDWMVPCDILGISATTAQIPWALEIARNWPARIKILGGAHATYLALGPHERFKRRKYFGNFDYIMLGEADDSLVEFCRQIDSGICPRRIPGLGWFESDGTLVSNPPAPVDVTQVAGPAFASWPIPWSRQGMAIRGRILDLPMAAVYTARGCPYGCRFCADARTGLREETLAQTIRQASQLKQLGAKAACVRDDTFTIKPKRSLSIAQALNDAGLKWRAMTRVNLVDTEFFRDLAGNGCAELDLGVESGSAKMLKLMGKGTTPEMNAAATEAIWNAGIVPCVMLMVGFPGETVETIKETRKWLTGVRAGRISFTLFQPYPGCDVWNHPDRYGVRLPDAPFDRWWQVGLEGTEDELVLDLPSITRKDLLQARRDLGNWIDDHVGSRDRTMLLLPEENHRSPLCAASAS